MTQGNNNENGWKEYSKLVLNEIERLDQEVKELENLVRENYNELKSDFTKIRELRTKVDEIKDWMEETKRVQSIDQLKELREEVYKQKQNWTRAITIVAFIQFLMTVAVILLRMFG